MGQGLLTRLILVSRLASSLFRVRVSMMDVRQVGVIVSRRDMLMQMRVLACLS